MKSKNLAKDIYGVITNYYPSIATTTDNNRQEEDAPEFDNVKSISLEFDNDQNYLSINMRYVRDGREIENKIALRDVWGSK